MDFWYTKPWIDVEEVGEPELLADLEAARQWQARPSGWRNVARGAWGAWSAWGTVAGRAGSGVSAWAGRPGSP